MILEHGVRHDVDALGGAQICLLSVEARKRTLSACGVYANVSVDVDRRTLKERTNKGRKVAIHFHRSLSVIRRQIDANEERTLLKVSFLRKEISNSTLHVRTRWKQADQQASRTFLRLAEAITRSPSPTMANPLTGRLSSIEGRATGVKADLSILPDEVRSLPETKEWRCRVHAAA